MSTPVFDREKAIWAVITAGVDWEGQSTGSWDRGAQVVDAIVASGILVDANEHAAQVLEGLARDIRAGYGWMHATLAEAIDARACGYREGIR